MPYIEKSSYQTPFGFKNGHLQSIFPQMFRFIHGVNYKRERIETPDHDFMDLDWCTDGKQRCAILIHGMEGHTFRPYVLGMVKAFRKEGWDTVSVNLRGCSGEPNLLLRSYHHGATDDLYTVISHVLTKGFSEICLVGFSLGGNMILKYLGEKVFPVPSQLRCSVAISAPCDLYACAKMMDQKSKAFYTMRFLKMLHKKLIAKKKIMPDKISLEGFEKIRTFKVYDDRYTAPFHGFSCAEDYYTKSGSLQFIEGITSPALLINAKDDPFLTPACSPVDIAKKSGSLFLEIPESGGHVGFVSFNKEGQYWHEKRAIEFVKNYSR